jgi:transposase
VHLIVDALGLPLTFEITEGQRHDIVPAKELVGRVLSRCLLADKAYDAEDFRASLDERGCAQVIPSNRSRSERRTYDKELYTARSERTKIEAVLESQRGAGRHERTFNLLKQARRFATRYEKTLRNYASSSRSDSSSPDFIRDMPSTTPSCIRTLSCPSFSGGWTWPSCNVGSFPRCKRARYGGWRHWVVTRP